MMSKSSSACISPDYRLLRFFLASPGKSPGGRIQLQQLRGNQRGVLIQSTSVCVCVFVFFCSKFYSFGTYLIRIMMAHFKGAIVIWPKRCTILHHTVMYHNIPQPTILIYHKLLYFITVSLVQDLATNQGFSQVRGWSLGLGSEVFAVLGCRCYPMA